MIMRWQDRGIPKIRAKKRFALFPIKDPKTQKPK